MILIFVSNGIKNNSMPQCVIFLVFWFQTMRTLVAILFLASMASAELLEAGNFQNYAHGISGKVYLKDEKTLVIKDFTYDGAGPDAFFWVGTSQSPSSVGTILPYPFEGKFYDYEDNRAPILSRRFNKEEVM